MQLGDEVPDGVPTTKVRVTIMCGEGPDGFTVEQEATVALHDLEHYDRLVDDFSAGLLPHLFNEIDGPARTAFHNHLDNLLGAQREAEPVVPTREEAAMAAEAWAAGPLPGEGTDRGPEQVSPLPPAVDTPWWEQGQ